jgi:hypothetical protein
LDDLLLEYAKAGCAEAVCAFLAENPTVASRVRTDALAAAGEAWCGADAGERDRYVTTLEALLAAGADASVLSSDVVAVLPSRRARVLADELPSSLTRPHTPKRI